MEKLKVVLHVDEMSKWSLTMANALNMIKDSNGDVSVEIVANSEAVTYYDTSKESDTDFDELISLHNKGVRLVACDNSLKALRIDHRNLLGIIEIVPAGVTELVKKQQAGYAYIKP